MFPLHLATNRKNGLCVLIHCNSRLGGVIRDIETFYWFEIHDLPAIRPGFRFFIPDGDPKQHLTTDQMVRIFPPSASGHHQMLVPSVEQGNNHHGKACNLALFGFKDLYFDFKR